MLGWPIKIHIWPNIAICFNLMQVLYSSQKVVRAKKQKNNLAPPWSYQGLFQDNWVTGPITGFWKPQTERESMRVCVVQSCRVSGILDMYTDHWRTYSNRKYKAKAAFSPQEFSPGQLCALLYPTKGPCLRACTSRKCRNFLIEALQHWTFLIGRELAAFYFNYHLRDLQQQIGLFLF